MSRQRRARLRERIRAAAAAFILTAGAAHAAPAAAQGAMQGLPHEATPPPSADLGAHARFSRAPIDLGRPDLALAAGLAATGGGVESFDATTFVTAIAGNGAAGQSELAALTKRFGAPSIAAFGTTFAFFVADAARHIDAGGMALPAAPATADPRTLAAQLFAAGTLPNGKYDDEYMLDACVSHIVNVAVMNDIDADPKLGPRDDATYHAVLLALFVDLQKLYALTPARSETVRK